MVALIILVSFSVVGIGALVHAVKNAPYVEEREDGKFEQNFRN